MSDEAPITAPAWKAPLLCVVALLMVLGMLRLGVWQLDRADQKREIVAQLESLSQRAAVPITELFNGDESAGLRFRKVTLIGQYLQNTNFYVDNQVVNGQVGYQVFTPLRLEGNREQAFLHTAIASSRPAGTSLSSILAAPEKLAL